ncbi:MAG TPA: LysR family transcriptional regulator, partial [Candidatus Dorea stercoravium]|nr:LysR family transcriptional regulator [Candidatus Dorea stercoravium]
MTFDQIRYFIAVMESNTFFEAAEKLHITQSTLSKQIMKLEKELDVRLLDRSRRRAS